MTVKRGALIVVEGVDRTGKSTQCKALVEALKKCHIPAEYTNFPDRSTEIGKVVNSYLTSKKDLPDETIHLLFAANRWEKAKSILQTLDRGISVIVDRYCYSGVAFSAAKGLDINWCKAPDAGLPRPDKVFFLKMPIENIIHRNGFGNERYEVLDFQEKVLKIFMMLKDDTWDVLNASRPIVNIHEDLLKTSLHVIRNVEDKSVGKIWVS